MYSYLQPHLHPYTKPTRVSTTQRSRCAISTGLALVKDAVGYRERIKSILSDNVAFRPNPTYKSGKLSFKRIHKVKFTPRVFERRTTMGLKDYHIALVVDCSGSMYHRGAMYTVMNILPAIIEMIQQTAKVLVLGFNTRTHILKLPHQIFRYSEYTNLVKRVEEITRGNGCYGNHDHVAVNTAVEMMRYKSGTKSIIVLSDGQPNCDSAYALSSEELQARKVAGENVCSRCSPELDCGTGGYLAEKLRVAVHSAISQGIYTHGIGIGTNAVKQFYPHYDVVTHSESIFPLVLKILKTTVKRVGVT